MSKGSYGLRACYPRYCLLRASAIALEWRRSRARLVSMTRIAETPKRPPGRWLLQDAKARFSELVRRVRSEGPQHVTVHGRDEVVVIAAEDFRRLKGDLT